MFVCVQPYRPFSAALVVFYGCIDEVSSLLAYALDSFRGKVYQGQRSLAANTGDADLRVSEPFNIEDAVRRWRGDSIMAQATVRAPYQVGITAPWGFLIGLKHALPSDPERNSEGL